MAALPYVIGGVGGFLIGGPLGAAAGLGIAKLISGTPAAPGSTTGAALPPHHQMPIAPSSGSDWPDPTPIDPTPIVTIDTGVGYGPKQGGLIVPEGPGNPPAGQEGSVILVGPEVHTSVSPTPAPAPTSADPIYLGPIGPGGVGPGDGPGGPPGQGGS